MIYQNSNYYSIQLKINYYRDFNQMIKFIELIFHFHFHFYYLFFEENFNPRVFFNLISSSKNIAYLKNF